MINYLINRITKFKIILPGFQFLQPLEHYECQKKWDCAPKNQKGPAHPLIKQVTHVKTHIQEYPDVVHQEIEGENALVFVSAAEYQNK